MRKLPGQLKMQEGDLPENTHIYIELAWMTVYFVWMERNMRVFQQKERRVETMIRMIDQEVYYIGKMKQLEEKYVTNLEIFIVT